MATQSRTSKPTNSIRPPARAPSTTKRKPAAAATSSGQQPDLSKLGQFPPPTEHSEQLAVKNQLLAMDCANRFFARSIGMAVAELETPAWVGLLKACRLYDPERINPITGRPYALSSFAVPFIKGAMKQYVRDKTFAIKFPHCWRELGPAVRRLTQQGLKPQQVCDRMVADGKRITVAEVEEILGCHKGTVELEHKHEPASDRLDDQLVIAEEDEQATERERMAWAVLEQAYGAICKADRKAIEEFWGNPRRIPIPHGPLQQFRSKVRALVGNRATGGMELMPLGFEVLASNSSKPRRMNRATRRSASELMADAVQADLFTMMIEPDETNGEP